MEKKSMNPFLYYNIIPYIEDYHDIITFILINKKCQKIVNSLPYYKYKRIHPQMIFPGLMNAVFNISIHTSFLQELFIKATHIKSLSLIIDKTNKNILSSNYNSMKKFLKKIEKKLKSVEVNIKIDCDNKLLLKEFKTSMGKFNLHSLTFTYTDFIELNENDCNLKKLKIILPKFISTVELNNLLTRFILHELVLFVSFECQWSYIRELANVCGLFDFTAIIHVSDKVIYEDESIENLLTNIPDNVIILFKNEILGLHNSFVKINKYEEDNIIQQDGDTSVYIPIPLPEIVFKNNSYTTQLKTIDLERNTWISSIETSYSLRNIILPTSIVNLKIYTPPSYLPMNLTQLYMENVNNSMVNLSSASFSQLILKRCNIGNLQVPTTLSMFNCTYNTFLKIGLNCNMKECVFKSSELPMLLIPTTCTRLHVSCSKIAYVQCTGLRQLQLYLNDFSKLPTTTTKLTQLTGLTFMSKSNPEFSFMEEVPVLKFSSSLKQCKLQHVCFSKLIGPQLTELHVEYVQPSFYTTLDSPDDSNDSNTLTSSQPTQFDSKGEGKNQQHHSLSSSNTSSSFSLSATSSSNSLSYPFSIQSPQLISPTFSLPCLSECHLKGIESLLSPIDAWRMYIDGATEIVLGSVNALHLNNCKGKISFSPNAEKTKLNSLTLSNCFFNNNDFNQFSSIENLQIKIVGPYKATQWNVMNFTNLKNMKLFTKSIKLETIQLPTQVTLLSITSEEIKGKLKPELKKQLNVLSLN